MKHLFVAGIAIVLLAACKKDNDTVLVDEATVTILHSTCVKTILKIDLPLTTKIGVSWSNIRSANPVIYQQVIQAGDMKSVPATGLEAFKQYKVRVYKKATGPVVTCYLLDQVNEPGVTYDIEFIK